VFKLLHKFRLRVLQNPIVPVLFSTEAVTGGSCPVFMPTKALEDLRVVSVL
jgi:hypothetical protein